MATLSNFKCEACGNKFEAHFGSLMRATELRCEQCDNRQMDKVGTKEGTCEKCGGNMKVGLLPMCPKCKSRNAKEGKTLMYMD